MEGPAGGQREPLPLRLLGTIIDSCIVLAGAGLVVLVFGNVLSRFALNIDVAWSSELAAFLLVWATFLGGAAATRRGAHMRIGEFAEALSGRPRAAVEVLILLLVAAILLQLAWFGWIIVERTWEQDTTVLYWPVGMLYAAMPVGSLLTLLWVVNDLVGILSGRVRFERAEHVSAPPLAE
jgi:TRAP-type transport system small permease protein